MFELSQRLIESGLRWSIDDYSLLFDQTVKSGRFSQKAMFRAGLWPIISNSEPEMAMGVGLILAALLEQWQSVRVYRLMARVPEFSSSYIWNINQSQFSVDDWEADGLDENIAIWGSFEVEDGHLRFSAEIENDAREDDDILRLEVSQDNLTGLLNTLPAIAEKIIGWIDPSIERIGVQYNLVDDSDIPFLEEFLGVMFRWELHYYLKLWDNDSDFPTEDLQALVTLSQNMKTDFGAWILAQSLSRIIRFDQINWSQILVSEISDILETLGDRPIFVSMTCVTLFRLDYGAGVFDLLESNLMLHPRNSLVWNTLAIIYNSLREDLATLDVYQRAIEIDSANASTYRRYADLIILLNNQQIHLKSGNQHVSPAGRPFVERYIYASAEEKSPNLYEAAQSYQNAVKHNPEDLEALMQLVKSLTILEDKQVWGYCQKLVEIDIEGGVTSSIIDQLPDDDVPFMIEILEKLKLSAPFQMSVPMNLARCYLAISEHDKANNELARIPRDKLSYQNQIIVSRLKLAAQVSDLDTRIAEIGDILDANGQISEEEIEFLETLLEKEPSFTEGYGLLARGYLNRNEHDAALEVLLDCQNDAPFDADVTALLAKVLWDEGQSDLAFAYLEKGLQHDKRNATLLALNGRFLFDDGLDEDAKEMLLLAEESDPLNAELTATRRYVANALLTAKKN